MVCHFHLVRSVIAIVGLLSFPLTTGPSLSGKAGTPEATVKLTKERWKSAPDTYCRQLRWVFEHSFDRSSYAARLQTQDGDANISPFTVGRELGHGAFLVHKV